MYTGSCLCGGVAFRIDGELAPIQICYCTQCRKAQGTPFAANIPVPTAAFALVRGSDLLKEFESSPGKRRVFCSACGSPVFSRSDSVPAVLRIRAGLIDGPLGVRPAIQSFVASKCDWWPVIEDLPRFAGARPRPD